MSSRRIRISSGLVLTVALAGAGWLFAQKSETPPPGHLLPRGTVIYVGVDGGTAHLDAWKKTAAYESLCESGLIDVVTKLVSAVQDASGGAEGIPGQFHAAGQHILDQGFSLAVSLGEGDGFPTPWAILVLHNGAPLEDRLGPFAIGAARGQIDFETKQEGARKITRGLLPRTPGAELAWWSEKGHLVVVAGLNAVESAIAVADGGANITANPLWAKYAVDKPGFEVSTVSWLDVASIRQKFGGMPVPGLMKAEQKQPVTVNEAATLFGLDMLQVVAARSGYKDRALWSEMKIDAPSPRKGLLSLSDQEPIQLSDLPRLPHSTSGFAGSSFDWANAYDTLLTIAHGAEAWMPPPERGQIDAGLTKLKAKLGFDLKTDLLAALGNIHCVYADSGQIPFGLGFAVAVEVDDAVVLRKSVDRLLALLEQQTGGEVVVRRHSRNGQELIVLEIVNGGISPALSIGEKWISIGLGSQSVDAFLLRQAGRLPHWEPSAGLQAALAEFPSKFTAITIADPRETYLLAAGVAPFLMNAAQAGLRQSRTVPPEFQFPVSAADIPPAELITRPLFENVAVAVPGKDGTTYSSRTSLPAGPFSGAVDGGTAFTTTAVATALLLPAVQQAREAARRSQSTNNLKQMMLAMHNYLDTYKTFPEGTVPNEKLKPDERLSWMTKILPFLDQAALHREIDFEEGWEDESNAKALKTRVSVFQNPSAVPAAGEYGVTNYVGIAGVGKDGPELPAKNPRAGIFAYNRGTRIQEITDGTSNTMAITNGTGDGPWGAGGRSTIRSLTQKPYINGPDGIGGPHSGGISVGFGDGSVRFLSEKIDPKVFEALSTIAGGEVIGDF